MHVFARFTHGCSSMVPDKRKESTTSSTATAAKHNKDVLRDPVEENRSVMLDLGKKISTEHSDKGKKVP